MGNDDAEPTNLVLSSVKSLVGGVLIVTGALYVNVMLSTTVTLASTL